MTNELRQKIGNYKEFPWESLLRDDLGRHSLADVRENFVNIRKYFDTILGYQDIGSLPQTYLQVLETQLDLFIYFAKRVQNDFQDVSQRKIWLDEVRQQDLNTWGALHPIIEYIGFISSNKEYLEREVQKKLEELEQVRESSHEILSEIQKTKESIFQSLMENDNKYREATKIAENWIETEGKATASVFHDKSDIFARKANDEHAGFWRVYSWLVVVLVFVVWAIISAIILITRLSDNGETISIGAALLRISIIGMFFYLAHMSYQLFSAQRHLYEAYKFKAIALSTMENLIKTFADHNDRKIIVEKAIDIIFLEPSFKEEKVAHQRVIDELLDVIKKKI